VTRRQPRPLPEPVGLGPRDALHLLVSLGDFQSRMTRDQDLPTVFDATRLLLRRLLPFDTVGFMTVEDETSEFRLVDCEPEEGLAALQEEIDATVDDGTFAWSLPQRRAVIVPARRRGHSVVLHPLLTRSRVLGMFAGTLESAGPHVTDVVLAALSVILFNTAQALENAALYRTMKEALAARDRDREAFESAADAIFTVDLDGRFTSANPAAARAFGRAADEIAGTSLLEALGAEHAEAARRMLEEAGRAPGGGVYELTAGANGRRVTMEVSARPLVRDGVVTGVQAIGRDVSRRSQADVERRQAHTMEAVGRLAGGVAHDLNNVLMVMRGYLDLMATRLASGEPLGGELEQVRGATDAAIALTRQLHTIGRRQALQPRPVDLNALIADLDPALRRLGGEAVDIATVLRAWPGRIDADPALIEEMITSLVRNARDAMPRGGRVRIETADAARGSAPHVMLAVADTGPGMDAATRARIFEPYFTTRERGKGAGLGLATVWGIVQQHRGAIEVESEVGRGTTFRVFLPAAAAHGGAAAAAGADGVAGSETVLVVDDEMPVRSLVRDILVGLGHRVLDAEDGQAALRLFEQHGADVALLVTDIVMPRMSGRALAERLLERRPKLKVLYMSGYAGDVLGRYGVLDPQLAFLQKPFTPDALGRKVRELLGPTRSPQPVV